MLYFDHAATTPVRPEVGDALADTAWGNPSGLHRVARAAKNALEEARERAAILIGASHPLELIFLGGGTEADNLALKGAALASPHGGVVTVATEHEAVLKAAVWLSTRGHPLSVIEVDRSGRVDPERVAAGVGSETAVVSVMAANNETGVRQPVRKVVEAVKAKNPSTLVHTDAVQAFISEDIDVEALGVDLLSLAAHKFGGPKGVGLLYVRDGILLEPLLHGGGQELGRRSGTQNTAGVVGMVAAMGLTVADRDGFRARVERARRGFETELTRGLPAVVLTGPIDDRLVQHSHFRIPGVSAETLLIRLDQAGLAASAGSACQSGATEPSHVLSAMGMSAAAAAECLRFSFGWNTHPDDGATAASIVIEEVGRLK